jgi:hypothetical protein
MKRNGHTGTFGTSDFSKVDIKRIVENMNCYSLSIHYKDDMDISLSYSVSDNEPYSDMCLLVIMDKRFVIKRFCPIFD